MAMTVDDLVKQAMMLPAEARARLVDLLVESLDTAEPNEIERLWLETAGRRRDDVRSGQVRPIDGEEGLRTVRDSLSR